MEHESMRARTGGVTILRSGAALALVAALAACGGGSGTTATTGGGDGCATGETLVGDECHTAAQVAASAAIEAAVEAVEGLEDSATTAQILAANVLVTTAQLRIDALPEADQAAENAKLADSIARINTLADDRGIIVEPTDMERIDSALGEAELAHTRASRIDSNAEASYKALNAASAQGDSSAVKDNALAVLAAHGRIDAQIKVAQGAQSDLMALHDATTDAKMKEEIMADIDTVKGQIKEMEDLIKTGSRLWRNIAVIPSDAKEDGSPDDRAMKVAEAVRQALTTDTDGDTEGHQGYGLRVFNDSNESALTSAIFRTLTGGNSDDLPKKLFVSSENNRPENAKKFKEIFSEATSQAISGVILPAIPLAGSSFSELFDATTGNTDDDFDDLAGSDFATTGLPVTHLGIAGRVIRRGASPAAAPGTATANFGAGWYFVPVPATPAQPVPASADLYYVPEGSGFAQAVWVDYGVWLTGPDDDLVAKYYAGVGAGSAALGTAYGTTRTAENDVPKSASYSGDAAGISARRDSSGDLMGSGRFDADVSMTARFGTDAGTIEGTINNFRGGADAVDPTWSLTMKDTDLLGGAASAMTNTFEHAGTVTGHWRARAYGSDGDKAPEGFYGVFSNSFTNGDVLGTFAAD